MGKGLGKASKKHALSALLSIPIIGLLGWAQESRDLPAHPPPYAIVTDPSDMDHALSILRIQRVHDRVHDAKDDEPALAYDAGKIFQEIDGYGGALTDSAVLAINSLKGSVRQELLNRLFDPVDGFNITYLRVPIGSTDFSESAYTYLDLPAGHEDPDLSGFNMDKARDTISLLHEIQKINPNLQIVLSPWSPPAWMKTGGKLEGGTLKPEHFATYARYLMKTIKRYETEQLPVSKITIQNEPYFSNDKYPSMSMEAQDQIRFIRDYFAPMLRASEYSVDILGLDHNYDLRKEADKISTGVKDDIGGMAYHCYGGEYSQMQGSPVPLYQTECTAEADGTPNETMDFWLGSQIIGAGLVGSKTTLGWNIALDKSHGPTFGYCSLCRGLADVDADAQSFTFNTEMIAMAQAGKFWLPGAHRIGTGENGEGYSYIGYLNPDGEIILVVQNRTDNLRSFIFRDRMRTLNRIEVPPHGGATVILPQ